MFLLFLIAPMIMLSQVSMLKSSHHSSSWGMIPDGLSSFSDILYFLQFESLATGMHCSHNKGKLLAWASLSILIIGTLDQVSWWNCVTQNCLCLICRICVWIWFLFLYLFRLSASTRYALLRVQMLYFLFCTGHQLASYILHNSAYHNISKS